MRSSRPISVDPGRWHAWDAMRTAMGCHLADIADMMGLSCSYLEKWRLRPNPHDNDSGVPSPLARLHDCMEACFRVGMPLEDVIAPLVWLAHKWGYEVAPRAANVNGDKPHVLLAESLRNNGELHAGLIDYLDPDSRGGVILTPEERQELRPLVDVYERNARELRALVDVEAA